MDAHEEILRKQAVLREEAGNSRIKLKMHDSRGSWLEGMLARGDRRLADVIEGAYRRGARFDSWDERLDLDAWSAALEEAAIDPTPFLGTQPVGARLPWDHIDVGLEPGFLAREYRKALRHRLSPPCGKTIGHFVHHTNVRDAKADEKRLVCYDCGVACDLTKMRTERIDFLRKMDAEAPRVRVTPAESPEPVDRRPYQHIDQGLPLRVRLGYRKLGRVAYSSHLDLVRSFPRMLRRIGLPLYYSEGYRPLPRLTFGPALPVGTPSLAEYVDVRLRANEMPDIPDIAGALGEVAMEGIEFFGSVALGPNDPALNRVVDEATYVAAIAAHELDDANLDQASLAALCSGRRSDLAVWREVKGIGKSVDVSAALIDIEPGVGFDVLRRAGIVGTLFPLRITLRLGGKTTPRPSEVLEAITGAKLSPRVVRVGLFARRGDSQVDALSLEALRAGPAVEAAE